MDFLDHTVQIRIADARDRSFMHTVGDEKYFFFAQKKGSDFFGRQLCFKEYIPSPVIHNWMYGLGILGKDSVGQSMPKFQYKKREEKQAGRRRKRSQLFIVEENDYYETNANVNECPICDQELLMEQKEILWCGHAFHNECLFKHQEQATPQLKRPFTFKCFVCGSISR